jgi:hypothetical protein
MPAEKDMAKVRKGTDPGSDPTCHVIETAARRGHEDRREG